MQTENIINKIISWTCVIGGIILFFIFLGDFIVKIIGAVASLWLINYGISLQGTSSREIYFVIRRKFKD